MSRPMSTSPAASQPGFMDPLMESMLDLTDYDNAPFQSPSLSPATSNKTPFARPVKTETTTPSLLPPSQTLSGPSHQYDLYKQQTGMVPGALASTLAVNSNSIVPGYADFGSEYLGGLGTADDIFDFNMATSQASLSTPEMVDLEFDSPTSDPNFFFDSTVNPSSIGGQEPSGMSSPQAGNVARVWPGMHQQAAAMAKAQAQQQQQQQQRQRAQAKQVQKPKSAQASDPIVEQKISQLLNSMRSKPSMEDSGDAPLLNISRPKKDEEDMDEDERLLASEEGKKLSSKERRQLRNKVSARAFRSRRKEYITHLESEITKKVNENGLLRAQNRALVEENKRLENLTRTLLASPAFSDFMDHLTSNPEQIPQPQPQPQPQQQESARQVPKDVNPYSAQQQQLQHQHISLAMIPEQNMDFSVDAFNYQPQVFSVLETPEPGLDASVLSGKSSDIVEEHVLAAEEEKVEMPVIERPAAVEKREVAPTAAPVDEKFESDPAFALYHDFPATEPSAPVELDTEALSNIDIFGGIEPEKMLARFELVDASEEDEAATVAMARVQRITAGLESIMARLELLTIGI